VVIDPEYTEWVEEQRENLDDLKKIVLSDDFWLQCKLFVKATTPAMKVLREVDHGFSPMCGKIYHRMWTVKEHLQEMSRAHPALQWIQAASQIFEKRWSDYHCDFYSAAYMVDPEFQSHKQEDNNEVMQGWLNVLERMVKHLWLDDNDVFARVIQQLQNYQDRVGIFGRDSVRSAAKSLAGFTWWKQFGITEAKELAKIAVRLLSQPCSSSASEQFWSQYDHIHSTKRNRLDPARASKLLFVRSNLRLLTQLQTLGYTSIYPLYIDTDSDDDADDEGSRIATESGSEHQ
jgi:hypothetical protein